jgi:translation initiation factor IF-2
MAKVLVGKVFRYFGKIGVAALKIEGALKVGDKISIEHADGSVVLEETVQSMQVNHADVQEAKAGDDVAIKLAGKAHEGNLVYKVE